MSTFLFTSTYYKLQLHTTTTKSTVITTTKLAISTTRTSLITMSKRVTSEAAKSEEIQCELIVFNEEDSYQIESCDVRKSSEKIQESKKFHYENFQINFSTFSLHF